MSLEREHQAEAIRYHEQHRQTHAQLLHECRGERLVGMTDSRGNHQGNGREKQQAGLQPRTHPVEFLHVMLESSEQK